MVSIEWWYYGIILVQVYIETSQKLIVMTVYKHIAMHINYI